MVHNFSVSIRDVLLYELAIIIKDFTVYMEHHVVYVVNGIFMYIINIDIKSYYF